MFSPAPAPDLAAFCTTLWIGTLLHTGNAGLDPFPNELDEIALVLFAHYRPVAKA